MQAVVGTHFDITVQVFYIVYKILFWVERESHGDGLKIKETVTKCGWCLHSAVQAVLNIHYAWCSGRLTLFILFISVSLLCSYPSRFHVLPCICTVDAWSYCSCCAGNQYALSSHPWSVKFEPDFVTERQHAKLPGNEYFGVYMLLVKMWSWNAQLLLIMERFATRVKPAPTSGRESEI